MNLIILADNYGTFYVEQIKEMNGGEYCMNFFNNIKVRTKLIVSFVIVAALIAVVGAIGMTSLKSVGANSENMYSNCLQSVYMMTDMNQNLTQINNETMQLIYLKDSYKRADFEKDIQDNIDENKRYLAAYEKLPMDAAEKQTYPTYKSHLQKYQVSVGNIIKLVDAGNYEEALKEYQQIEAVRGALDSELDKLINENNSNAKASNLNNRNISSKSNNTMIILIIAGLIVAVGLGTILSKDISTSLLKMVHQAEDLAKFDLSHNYLVTRKDEFGKTGSALVKAQESIKELVKTIIVNSEEMSASSEELSATVQELLSKAETIDESVNKITSGIENSGAASEEISASVQEVDSSINVLASKASEGSNNAIQAKERATAVKNKSKKAINETRELYSEKQTNMEKAIEEGKVVDSVKIMADTIGSIAEQTNLLALNAAIEAARAGEQGKGFAVVAEEIRKLAEQSSQAVVSIQDTIKKVQAAFKSSTNTGSDILEFINIKVNEQFNAYGETGNQYYEDSEFVSKMSEEIAAMSEEITATVGQVTSAVQNMDQMSQSSAEEAEMIKVSVDETTKAVEQVALTAQSQAELAQKLNEIVQQFKI